MLVGVAFYVVYRRRQGLPLTETVKIAPATPLGVEDVEYKSVLVVFRGGEFADEVVATAKAVAARRRRAIHVSRSRTCRPSCRSTPSSARPTRRRAA